MIQEKTYCYGCKYIVNEIGYAPRCNHGPLVDYPTHRAREVVMCADKNANNDCSDYERSLVPATLIVIALLGMTLLIVGTLVTYH